MCTCSTGTQTRTAMCVYVVEMVMRWYLTLQEETVTVDSSTFKLIHWENYSHIRVLVYIRDTAFYVSTTFKQAAMLGLWCQRKSSEFS